MSLEILSPQQGQVLSLDVVRVKVRAPADAAVAVNGVVATARIDGTFTADIVLEDGSNLIDITASDPSGASVYEDIAVFVFGDDESPPLDLTGPPDGQILSQPFVALVGTTDPGASVSVNGVNVIVNQFGIFETEVTLEQGPNLIEVVSADASGASTTKSLTVFVE